MIDDDVPAPANQPSLELEAVPADEAGSIARNVDLTRELLRARYLGAPAVRRGVHPKDHGCVAATFTVLDPLPESLQVGVFAEPGRRFEAFIRFSNADVNPEKADSAVREGVPVHGSRGMAVKLLGVTGAPLETANLLTTRGPLHQDFLMINQPVFAFANIADYLALNEAMLRDQDSIDGFFERLQSPEEDIRSRAARTGLIIKCITSDGAPPPPYQAPPASPLDNRYFSAAAFLFGPGRAMKFSAKPRAPVADEVADAADPNYLRTALRRRLEQAEGKEIELDFQVQVRNGESLVGAIADQIEDACVEWPEGDEAEGKFPFVTVARIAIPSRSKDIEGLEQRAFCEDLIFSPWNGLADHRPLGGINRMRQAVYAASAKMRHAGRNVR